jgi:hypothetical protein
MATAAVVGNLPLAGIYEHLYMWKNLLLPLA